MVPNLAVTPVSLQSKAPWWRHATGTQLVSAGVALVVILFCLLSGVDELIRRRPAMFPLGICVNLAVALLCGGLVARVIHDARARSRKVLKRLQIVAEMNHHIRNALEDIELTAHTAPNRELTKSIDLAVSRVDWALRELLPQEMENTAEVPRRPSSK